MNTMKNLDNTMDDYSAELARRAVGELFDNSDDYASEESEEEVLTIYKKMHEPKGESIFIIEEDTKQNSNQEALPQPKPAIRVNNQAIDAALAAKRLQVEEPKTEEPARRAYKPITERTNIEAPGEVSIEEKAALREVPVRETPPRKALTEGRITPREVSREERAALKEELRERLRNKNEGGYVFSETPEETSRSSDFARSYTIHRAPERPSAQYDNTDEDRAEARSEARPRAVSRPARSYSPQHEENESVRMPAFLRGIAVGLTLMFMLLLAFLVFRNLSLTAQLQEAETQLATIPALETERTELLLQLQQAEEELVALTQGESGYLPEYNTEPAYGYEHDTSAAQDPAPPEAPVQAPTAPEEGQQPAAPSQPRTHTVVAGDMLSRIARNFYNSNDFAYVQRIMDANNIADADVIVPGMQLIIP